MFSTIMNSLITMLVFFLIIDICVLYGATIVGSKEGAIGGICCNAHGDVIIGTKVTYCITIQQLEVLIRLLKDIACFHYKFEVRFQLQM
jgi:hypothetical protein